MGRFARVDLITVIGLSNESNDFFFFSSGYTMFEFFDYLDLTWVELSE